MPDYEKSVIIFNGDTMKHEEIRARWQVGNLAAKVLEHRNLNEEQIDDLLNGDAFVHDNDAKCIQKAVERLHLAKNRNEKILIAGDYDCDGICATAIMKDTFDRFGIESGFYIPNRFKEGYGLNENTVKLAYEKGYSLIVTVDNGVTADKAIDLCRSLNMDILVTDHHTIQSELNWNLLVHPDLMGKQFQGLCGAGVALQISRALLGEIKEHVILAAIATIGDMMDVFYENRSLIKTGLIYLNERNFLPVERLCERPLSFWTEKEIAFQIVPKLNAIGRLADMVNANNVVRYLLAKDRSTIEAGASQIKDINQQRRKLSKSMSDMALGMMEDDNFICVVHDEFHEGLLGLIANTISTSLHKPSVIFTRTETLYKGSVRSSGGLNLFDFFSDFEDTIEQFGGHAQAAGIQVLPEKMEEFKAKLHQKASTLQLSEEKEQLWIHSTDCSVENIEELERLRPYGHGFEAPVFMVDQLNIIGAQAMKNQYPKWNLSHPTCALEAISFSLSKESIEKQIVAFEGTLSINQFMSTKRAQILVNGFIEK